MVMNSVSFNSHFVPEMKLTLWFGRNPTVAMVLTFNFGLKNDLSSIVKCNGTMQDVKNEFKIFKQLGV